MMVLSLIRIHIGVSRIDLISNKPTGIILNAENITLAKNLYQTLSTLIGQLIDDGHAFPGNGKLTPEQDQIRKLKAQVKRLEMEREILKTATLFCAKETK